MNALTAALQPGPARTRFIGILGACTIPLASVAFVSNAWDARQGRIETINHELGVASYEHDEVNLARAALLSKISSQEPLVQARETDIRPSTRNELEAELVRIAESLQIRSPRMMPISQEEEAYAEYEIVLIGGLDGLKSWSDHVHTDLTDIHVLGFRMVPTDDARKLLEAIIRLKWYKPENHDAP